MVKSIFCLLEFLIYPPIKSNFLFLWYALIINPVGEFVNIIIFIFVFVFVILSAEIIISIFIFMMCP